MNVDKEGRTEINVGATRPVGLGRWGAQVLDSLEGAGMESKTASFFFSVSVQMQRCEDARGGGGGGGGVLASVPECAVPRCAVPHPCDSPSLVVAGRCARLVSSLVPPCPAHRGWPCSSRPPFPSGNALHYCGLQAVVIHADHGWHLGTHASAPRARAPFFTPLRHDCTAFHMAGRVPGMPFHTAGWG